MDLSDIPGIPGRGAMPPGIGGMGDSKEIEKLEWEQII
ncbi:MAG: hypothetical protein Ct9H90mP2_12840 [Dehalococcoidia bacterium]|nr:MAG: hypothetical protein Ct9H90mP2_12840 [Dehalococcoidia bacterium]